MAEESAIKKNDKFSLIELLMIIMLVGIVFTLVIPLRNDYVYKDKMKEAVRNIQIIARADIAFKENPENGYYAFDLSMLNVKDKLEKETDDFLFEYSLTDTTVIATSTAAFGKKGVEIFYYLPSGPWQLGDSKVTKNTLDANWLP